MLIAEDSSFFLRGNALRVGDFSLASFLRHLGGRSLSFP